MPYSPRLQDHLNARKVRREAKKDELPGSRQSSSSPEVTPGLARYMSRLRRQRTPASAARQHDERPTHEETDESGSEAEHAEELRKHFSDLQHEQEHSEHSGSAGAREGKQRPDSAALTDDLRKKSIQPVYSDPFNLEEALKIANASSKARQHSPTLGRLEGKPSEAPGSAETSSAGRARADSTIDKGDLERRMQHATLGSPGLRRKMPKWDEQSLSRFAPAQRGCPLRRSLFI
ncbi:hypothetical protein JCM10908_005513 [Rhodotorula pacifica]|uniref:uncharacterized protein n=1 Tax=Rhodotorula pacifica TaxID=1495444 RepID=UPI00316F5612